MICPTRVFCRQKCCFKGEGAECLAKCPAGSCTIGSAQFFSTAGGQVSQHECLWRRQCGIHCWGLLFDTAAAAEASESHVVCAATFGKS